MEVVCLPLFENFKVVAVGIGEGTGRTVVSGYPIHTLVHFMSPWFVPSYTPRQGMAQLIVYQHLAQCLHDKSLQEIEESKRGCSRVIVKHRSQSVTNIGHQI